MYEIINKLKEKQIINKRKLRIYSIFDSIISFAIITLNISSISLAIFALVKLVLIAKKAPETTQSVSFVLLIVFAALLVFSFFLTIALSIYKHNSNYDEYNKILNTLDYIQDKYMAKKLNDEQLETILDALWEKASMKRKLAIKKAVKSDLKTSNKAVK
ncbi:hypothetical protein MCANUFG4_00768 [Mycoplasmopsis canis UFG4]|uniref:Transmembrane protein n=2 Tax=Mycoplasmopsis canis TaxID=29555 RepID=I1A6K1_9BACT|nr:hypothetical protein [Mycoplasmopsis canis]AKF41244.1 hypothetical protein AAW50_02300 [Mycoplasmopsis canis]AMD81356.1 hypothetical protein AXW82_02230 [Mycoplasmopsis canis PG 14]EIE40360.1 hypothetical protein MCANUF31_00763 [Mycoplasmopsis canis UF31]EIE40500.1 hypothetical protein MCANPG14_00788 [Mycoplasmopsis canis PG 14]EIE40644.1 hypothetical protein MCANUF33_00788 [Mycoplasmopsis canis UF33]